MKELLYHVTRQKTLTLGRVGGVNFLLEVLQSP